MLASQNVISNFAWCSEYKAQVNVGDIGISMYLLIENGLC